jgi:hypothetical protein
VVSLCSVEKPYESFVKDMARVYASRMSPQIFSDVSTDLNLDGVLSPDQDSILHPSSHANTTARRRPTKTTRG